MHAVGLHSALAIKRQRKRREEQKRARERRYSTHSNDSNTPRNSIVSLDGAKFPRHRAQRKPGLLGTKVVTSVGMLHIGVVFLVFGLFLLVSALLPSSDEDANNRAKKAVWNELLFSGIFCLCLGILLIILNRIVSKKADDDLSDYVTHQLNRSKSGHRLVRDAETGHMISAKARRKEESIEDIKSNGEVPTESVPSHIHITTTHVKTPISSPPPCIEGEPPLEKIVEEDSEYSLASSRPQRFFGEEKGEEESRTMECFNKETMSNDSTTASLSPGTPSETQELLTSRSMKMYRM
ncbi:hypothetical protein B566_EDAN012999 [Ephemera danica]|nr:hypothetical protein B566_EDAN012999 [Ephemera danica]